MANGYSCRRGRSPLDWSPVLGGCVIQPPRGVGRGVIHHCSRRSNGIALDSRGPSAIHGLASASDNDTSHPLPRRGCIAYRPLGVIGNRGSALSRPSRWSACCACACLYKPAHPWRRCPKLPARGTGPLLRPSPHSYGRIGSPDRGCR